MIYINNLLTALMVLCCPVLLHSQTKFETASQQSSLESQLEIIQSIHQQTSYAGLTWTYLKFQNVPTEAQKQNLASAGVTLYQYEPDLIWFASIPVTIDAELLSNNAVVDVFTKDLAHKIDQRILQNRVPAYAQTENGTEATIVVATTISLDDFNAELESQGATIISTFLPLGFIKINASEAALKAIASLPFIVYVELPEPPEELEFEDEITLARGANINGYYNLDGLNGDGITIAVNEGGAFDTARQMELRGRLDRSLESGNASGHKTGVGLRMASAGNIIPSQKGEAWGATLASGGINFTTAAQNNVNIVNNSFGAGCIPAGPTYNSAAATNDFLVRTKNRFMITYSCGNMGNSTCANYGAGQGWGNITGLMKSGKNIFATGSMDLDDQLTGFSSRGPAMDGRILPDITTGGPGGTSHASPNLAGINALLTQAYLINNTNAWPNSGLIKAIILNTADDVENPGPDYKTGFGRVNAARALNVIENSQHLTDSVANNATKTHSIAVPSGVSQLKVMLYWNDREATAGITGKTLINDLNLRLQQPNTSWVLPWVLDPFPHADSLNKWAVHAVDSLNNVELITIDNPAAGNYTAEINGALVPLGPQDYFIVHSFVYDSIKVMYPTGGEGLVPGENRRIRWDAYDTTATFSIDYSIDSGTNWVSITTGLSGKLRSYNWSIPTGVSSGRCKVRVTTSGKSAVSESCFTIAAPPANLNVVWRCADSVTITWDTVPGALGYWVYKLGIKYMDTVGYTTTNYATLNNLPFFADDWLSVQTLLPDGGTSRRAIAISTSPGNLNCTPIDLALEAILSPAADIFPSCLAGDSINLKLKIRNRGIQSLAYEPIAIQINGGAIIYDTLVIPLASAAINTVTYPNAFLLQSGLNSIKVWTNYPGDLNTQNDTISLVVDVYSSSTAPLPYSQNFDAFTNCSNAWGCSSITCNLLQGWKNIDNINGADSIDWRTNSGATGTGGTGPSSDHTSGTGKYLYLEGSGNSGGGCTNKTALAYTPCFDLSGTNNPTLSYWYHAFGGGIGSLHIDVLADGQWHLDAAQPVVGAQGNQWLQKQASLSQFTGKKIIVRFRGTTGNGFRADLAIDDIGLNTLPLSKFETIADSFCLGQQVDFQNTTTYGNNYSWSVTPNTFNYTAGNGFSNSPSITPTDTGWYNVTLRSTNATGSDTLVETRAFYVGNFQAPVVTTNAVNNLFCAGDSATFTAAGTGGDFWFYQNSALKQASPDSIFTTNSINDGDSIQVTIQINTGCTLRSTATYVTVNPDLNGKPIWTNDTDLTICQGDIVTITTESGLKNYQFFQNSGSTQSSTDSSWTTNLLANNAATYAVITDSIGCTGTTDSLIWTVNPIPAQPSIINLGADSLKASVNAATYSWWRDLQILGSTTQSILAVQSGSYAVAATALGCTSTTSDAFAYTLLSTENQQANGIQIFPNPADEKLHILLESNAINTLTCIDNTGKVVFEQSITQGENTINLSELSAGVYTLDFSGTEEGFREKLVVR